MQYFLGKDGKPCSLGRMGDQVIAYAKAKWFAHKYHLPYLYKPFPYSEFFALHTDELSYDDIPNYKRLKVRLFQDSTLQSKKEDNVCYAVDYLYASPEWEWSSDVGLWTDAMNEKEYLRELRAMLTPNIDIPELVKPEGKRTVAVHIRKGSYFDNDGFFSEQEFIILPDEEPETLRLVSSFMDVGEPYKFPPNQYYIDQIKRLSARFSHAPLHVVLFTDYHTPEELLSVLRKNVNLENITYGIASEVTFEKLGTARAPGIECTLKDLMLMTQCDCLIRSGSNYAQVAHLLGEYEVVYFPRDAAWYGNRLTYARIGCVE